MSNILSDAVKDELVELRKMRDELYKELKILSSTIRNREELLDALGEGPPFFGDNI